MHALHRLYGSKENDIPVLDKDLDHQLEFLGGDRWRVATAGETIRNYSTSDLRTSIVYRARCFADEEASLSFHRNLHDDSTHMQLEDVLRALAEDMVARGVLRSATQALEEMPRLDFAMKILDTYVRYPRNPDMAIPVNYCALSRLQPWLAPLLSPFCAS